MQYEYKGLSSVNGPIMIVEGVENVAYEEICEINLPDGQTKLGKVIEVAADKAVVQVFEALSACL